VPLRLWLDQPDLAVALLVLGFLLLLLELHRPGLVVPGATGVLLVLSAAWGLAQNPLHPESVAAIAAACLLMLLETRVASWTVAAVAGTALMAAGMRTLIRIPTTACGNTQPACHDSIAPVSWALAMAAGGVTALAFVLASVARRARERKYRLTTSQPATHRTGHSKR
jgi:membrane-bound serine protease (ClpP class)